MDIPQDILNEATLLMLETGVRVFQGARLASTEAEHVSMLLRYMDPPRGATIADVGCGVGEVARLMKVERDDLDFVLINNNELQLSHAPDTFRRICCDMNKMELDTGSVDGAMLCYSLCHSDLDEIFAEVARIVKRGGFLFVYDYERTGGDNELFKSRLYAEARSRKFLTAWSKRAGWKPVFWLNPDTDDAIFRKAYANDTEYDMIFGDLLVCLWKMENRGYVSGVAENDDDLPEVSRENIDDLDFLLARFFRQRNLTPRKEEVNVKASFDKVTRRIWSWPS